MNRLPGLWLLFLLTPTLVSAGPDVLAEEAVGQSALFSSAPHFQLTCQLTVIDATGDQKIRDLMITNLRSTGEDRFLAQVTAPTFLRSLKFLRIESQGNTGTWLKTSRGTQRMASDGDPEPLFGSDFSTADFQPGTQAWTMSSPQELGQTTVERLTDARWGWVRQRMTIRTRDHLVVNSEFFDAKGGVVRRYQVLQFEETGRPHKIVLEDLMNSRRSELTVLSFDPDKSVPVSFFTPGSL
jgi:hypothetical protein